MNSKSLRTGCTQLNWTTAAGLLAAAGAGAGLMYLFDPQRGKARRHLLHDRTLKAVRDSRKEIDKSVKHLTDQAEGIAAEVRHALHTEPPTDNATLTARVRTRLGRASSHAHAIQAEADDGLVILTGPVLVDEAKKVVDAVTAVPGVTAVENRMAMYESLRNVPGVITVQHKSMASMLVPALLGIGGGILTAMQSRTTHR